MYKVRHLPSVVTVIGEVKASKRIHNKRRP